jgi:hypothetical protein
MTAGTSPFFDPPTPPNPPARGWSGSDLLILTSLIVLLVALFMPWFSGTVRLNNAAVTRSLGSADGPSGHGYLWFVFALCILSLLVLVGGDVISRIPGKLPTASQLLMVATGIALLLTILGVAIRPSPSFDIVSSTGAVPEFLPRFDFSVGWSYGGFVAIAAAAVAFAACFRQAGRLSPARSAVRLA